MVPIVLSNLEGRLVGPYDAVPLPLSPSLSNNVGALIETFLAVDRREVGLSASNVAGDAIIAKDTFDRTARDGNRDSAANFVDGEKSIQVESPENEPTHSI